MMIFSVVEQHNTRAVAKQNLTQRIFTKKERQDICKWHFARV